MNRWTLVFLLCAMYQPAFAQAPTAAPAPASAAGARAPTPPSPDEVAALAPLLSLSEFTSAGATEGSRRRDLDVETVVGLVRERLGKVAVAALADLFEHLSKGALRPWAKDLLAITAKLATATAPEARVLVDRALRALARAVLADAILRANEGWPEATQLALADWSYWYLAQLPLLRDVQVARPECAPSDELCNQLAKSPKKELEARLHVDQLFEALRMVQKLHGDLRKTPAEAQRVLSLLSRVDSLGELPGADELNELRAKLENFATLRAHVESLKTHCGKLPSDKANLTDWKSSLKTLLDQEVTLTEKKAVRDWMLFLTWRKDALTRLFATDLDVSKDLAAMKVDAALCKDVSNASSPTAALRNRIETAKALPTRALDQLTPADAEEAAKLLTVLATELTQLELGGLPADELGLSELVSTIRGTGYLLKQLRSLAGPTNETLGDVHKILRLVRPDEPLFKLLAPVLTTLASGAELGRAELYRALLELAPTDLLDALHLPQEDRCANDQGGSWQCWAGRLALSVHSALSMEGETLKLEPDALVASLAKLAASERATQRGSFHLLASVGTGVLYTDGSSRPLVAEQLGGTWLVHPGERLSVSAGLYASGLLYRYVLDGDVANGLIFGGTLRARLYDLLEVHADVVDAFSFRGDSGEHHLGLVFGVQVPLGDYLERSGE